MEMDSIDTYSKNKLLTGVSDFFHGFSSFLFFFVAVRLSRDECWNSSHLYRALGAWLPTRMLDALCRVRLCSGRKPLSPSPDISETNSNIHLGTEK
jgi:hypothetical protein